MTTTGTDPRPTADQQADDVDHRTGALWTVIARREVAVKLTDRSFVLGTLLSLGLIVGLVGVQVWMDSRTHDYEVAVSSAAAGELAGAVADQAPDLDDDVSVEVVDLADDDAARTAVADEEVDAWLRPPAEAGDPWTLVGRDDPDDRLQRLVRDVLSEQVLAETAREAGTTLAEVTAGAELTAEPLDGDDDLGALRDVLGFALAFLFYVATIMFGMTLASSVVEEKQSRIVEMIAAAVPLRQLLAGKIAGNTALALGQMVVYVAIGMVALTFTDFGDLVPALSGEMGWFLVFFLVGFVALSCLWAVAGALASRTEDLQHTSGAVTMLILAMFFGALFLDGTAAEVASYVPPLSAILMPTRLVDGTAAWWEPLVALGLLLAFAAVLVLVAERLYRRALLQTGGRLSLRAAWSLEE
ncbi:ABC transporter permease [Nocardioides sp. TF02-7]|uniref:ABC transporter permease n=1 Tax=Nocardioides sp. TF02-7 TaxID=2917724 RepID=UPI001F052423|nr:ABC transporter permease [Nocardioides sp. TF02-7]UMG91553.1 ABC transporter permease [Nocardioides sp. TF02-7]